MSDRSAAPVRKYFPRVRDARQAMQEKAASAVSLYFKAIRQAIEAGDNETATKSLQWYMEHVAVEDGVRMIDPGVDKKADEGGGGKSGPVINVGIALGGFANGPKELPPAEVIDVKPDPDHE